MALDTVTVKAVPKLLGVTLAGFTMQLGGAPVPQLRFTGLPYPLIEVRVPLKTAGELTCVVSDELAMPRL
jgi:hypothetical protein